MKKKNITGGAHPDVKVVKASGERTTFQPEKLRQSLLRSGAAESHANDIVRHVTAALYDGITTKEIYHEAFRLLREKAPHLAAKYNLKQAIMALGPSGFPFERYIAEVLKHQGYEANVGQVVKGKCVSHEIDVVATKDGQRHMIECKYHNTQGTVSDVKIPLYIRARFTDVTEGPEAAAGAPGEFHFAWVVTNTRFTADAIAYGNCAGLKMIAWDYPARDGLRTTIDALRLYPLTCLTTLTASEKQRLLANKIVMCHELCDAPQLLTAAGIRRRTDDVIGEATMLCARSARRGHAGTTANGRQTIV